MTRPIYTLIPALCLLICVFGSISKMQAEPDKPSSSVFSIQLIDAQTQVPLVGVSAFLPDEKKLLFSDELGRCMVPILDKEKITIEFRLIGYAEQQIALDLSSLDQKPLKIALEPVAIDLAAISITAEQQAGLQPIAALDLQLKPIQSSQDVLQFIPGLFIAQHAGGGKAEQIFLRGFDIDHGTDIHLTVDGMPVNMVSHAHGQGYSDLHFLIPETIQRVEFDKGMYEADKGNFATAGYAAFQTQNSLAQHELKLELGQFNTFRGLGMFNLLPTESPHQAFVAAEYQYSDGYFNASQHFHRSNVLAKYTGQLSESSVLKFSASFFNSSWDASGQIPERAVAAGIIDRFGAIDSTEGGQTGRKNVNLELFHSLNPTTSLKNQLFYTEYDFSLFSNFTFFLEEAEAGDQIHQEEKRRILGSNNELQHRFETGQLQAKSTLGLSLRVDQIEDISLARTQNRSSLLTQLALGDVQEMNAAAYISQELSIGDKVKLEAALRYDFFNFAYENALTEAYDRQQNSKGILSPKLTASYQFNPKVRLYGKAGIGFHSNDSRLILSQQNDHILPKAYGADLGLYVKPSSKVLFQLAGWWLDLEQEFIYVGDEGIVEPSGASRRLGADLSTRVQLSKWLFFDADVNYSHARSLEEERGADYIPLAPRFSSVGGLRLQLRNGISGSLRYRHLGDRAANEDFSLIAEGYHIWDAVVQYETSSFRLSLTAQNLLNVAWKEAQFETTSRLAWENTAVTEIHYTPGSPFFAKMSVSYLW